MGEILTEFIGLLVGGISEMGAGIGLGANDTIKALLIETTETGTALSTFGGMIAIFGGIALAVGFTYLIFNWVTSIGN